MSRKYFGTDGIRGKVGEDKVTPEFILKLGWAAGRVLGQKAGGSVLIGKDTRISGYMFESALEAGLAAAGMNVLLTGPMPTPDIAYLTNDRLFIRRVSDTIEAVGIPKLPRVNPGTVVHNPALHSLIPPEKRDALLRLPAAELWELEEKYDVHVDRTYGPGRITLQAPLSGFLVLNWHPAKIFLGDVGSLALGGGIGIVAVVTTMMRSAPASSTRSPVTAGYRTWSTDTSDMASTARTATTIHPGPRMARFARSIIGNPKTICGSTMARIREGGQGIIWWE